MYVCMYVCMCVCVFDASVKLMVLLIYVKYFPFGHLFFLNLDQNNYNQANFFKKSDLI